MSDLTVCVLRPGRTMMGIWQCKRKSAAAAESAVAAYKTAVFSVDASGDVRT